MEKEDYFELKNNSGDIMTIYRDEPNVVPLSEEWTRTLCRYFTWFPEFTSIQPHRFPKMADFIDDYIKVDIEIDTFVKLTDYFLDNFISDLFVQSKITSASKQVDEAIYETENVLNVLKNAQ